MSYSIMQIIYGIPLTEAVRKILADPEKRPPCPAPEVLASSSDDAGSSEFDNEDEIRDECDPDDLDWDLLESYGYRAYYRNGDGVPAMCGVELGEFDEACDFVDPTTLPLQPSDEQRREAMALIERLPQQLRDASPPVGVYFIPTSS